MKSYVESETGEMQVLAFHLPGDVIGTDLPDVNPRRSASTVALERSLVCEVRRPSRDSGGTPALFDLRLVQQLTEQARQLQVHLQTMGRARATQRLAAFVMELSARYRRLNRDPDHLFLPMPRADLANYLGVATETVSRMIAQQREIGAVDFHGQRVHIQDRKKLQALVGGIATPATQGLASEDHIDRALSEPSIDIRQRASVAIT